MAWYFDDLELLFSGLDAVFDRAFDQSWPDLYSVQFLTAGRMVFGRDDVPERIVEAPALYWVAPEHSYRLRGVDDGDRRHFLLFRGPRGRRILREGFARLSDAGVLPVLRPTELDGAFRGFDVAFRERDPQGQAEAVLWLERILLLAAHAPPERRDEVDRRVLTVIDSIRRDPCAELDWAAVARGLGMSYSLFRKRFRRLAGRPPQDFLLHGRMRRAAELLRNGALRVKGVGAQVGMPDPARFSRTFRRQIGLSPEAYRRAVGS